MQIFKRFLIQELLFTALLAVLALVLFKTALAEFYLPVFWILMAVIALLTALFHYSIIQIQDSTSKFTSRFMMVSGIKMMIYLGFITSYAFIFPDKAKTFLISFFILYLLYTVFEVVLTLKYLKRK